MSHYLLSVVYPADGVPPSPEELQEITGRVEAFKDELKAAGAWVFAGGLHDPDAATVVRVEGNEVLTADGPFVETKEQLGGLNIIEAPDLDAALRWAEKASRATGTPIEVRPFQWASL
ncbi:hypothetical protein ER308_08455 [Egibacter rhizosphaerae]|uniref:YCII-related domain-containing protein n=1 Tax=Egibacter rhizosphaerae TaxID=1670831 RepID=A0A411YEF0_9ACTN|nr:YciI family protein [Egibacter rhizosphaerae]QBI19578.1 hypothetical protein ER308_08455 [Egibacter rhizosphaerae]